MMINESEKIAVRVENVTKVYRILDTPLQRINYYLFKSNVGRDFVALDDISFEVRKGESFGIIGRNGSGKSTMLQILAGIIGASKGTVKVNGKVAALLELGSGFNPESTGYENIFMNAAILGVKKKDIEAKIQEIVEFADIGDFINQPVKTYSSGMFVRLAFAVAINVDADIILIDEALAVGDIFFRQKCYSKLNELKKLGKTIILVSHGMNEVEQFCDRAMMLIHGKICEIGDSREVVKKYYLLDNQRKDELQSRVSDEKCDDLIVKNDISDVWELNRNVKFGNWKINDDTFIDISKYEQIGNAESRFLRIGIFDENGRARRVFTQGEWAYFYIEEEIKSDIDVPIIGTVIYDQRNIIVHGKDDLQINVSDLPHKVRRGNTLIWLQKIQLNLGIGEYTFDIAAGSIPYDVFENRSSMNQEEVNTYIKRMVSVSGLGPFSIHTKAVGDPMKLMFHGLADLPGSISLRFNE